MSLKYLIDQHEWHVIMGPRVKPGDDDPGEGRASLGASDWLAPYGLPSRHSCDWVRWPPVTTW
jgi:hypothetical protein